MVGVIQAVQIRLIALLKEREKRQNNRQKPAGLLFRKHDDVAVDFGGCYVACVYMSLAGAILLATYLYGFDVCYTSTQ